MDARGEDAVAMMGPAAGVKLQDTRWRRTRLALACCVSCCFLLASLSAYLLVKQLPPQKVRERETLSSSLRLSNDFSPQMLPSFSRNFCFLFLTSCINKLTVAPGPQKSEVIGQPLDIVEKPRAHLTAKLTSVDGIDGQYSALQWEDKNGLAFTEGQLNYQNPALIIPRQGTYFVYSQVSFRSSSKVKNITHISHIITKLTSSYPEPTHLLSSTRSLHGNQNRWQVTIYLGAIFQLQRGDRKQNPGLLLAS
ncbi:tumor necrosis factor ligand superfamily member 15-like isoform X2 [Stegostoma tigrinum]|uniref:tumor necrosis factor ligand superfamily member 15-like isoform X2 n=1 Tax=Stegostoma tigrinum TaxID=3053191 RepID=UPI0028706985|nr:tumor necrosis factor ligand superfamily member 15-like isoform X2 [Stegostoma tigrinum]